MKRVSREEIRKNPDKFANELLNRIKNRGKPELKLIIGGKK
ncbi:MAG: hypothetical protein ACQEXE_05030 [Bacillota bacterium]